MTAPSIWDEEFIANWDEPLTRAHVKGRNPSGRCEYCGKNPANDMHHRRNRSQGGTWCPSNIIWLCRLCHHKVTTHPQWAKSVGLMLDNEPEEPAAVRVKLANGQLLELHDRFLPAGRNA